MSPPKNPLSDRQLESKYNKYLKKLEKQKEKINRQMEKSLKTIKTDKDWESVKKEVYDRDRACQLWYKLTRKEIEEVKDQTGYFLLDTEDYAHVFGRGVYPHLKYDPDNVVMLTRLFHSRLDHFYNPISGEQIDKKEQEEWWIRIVGIKRYKRLKKKARKQ